MFMEVLAANWMTGKNLTNLLIGISRAEHVFDLIEPDGSIPDIIVCAGFGLIAFDRLFEKWGKLEPEKIFSLTESICICYEQCKKAQDEASIEERMAEEFSKRAREAAKAKSEKNAPAIEFTRQEWKKYRLRMGDKASKLSFSKTHVLTIKEKFKGIKVERRTISERWLKGH